MKRLIREISSKSHSFYIPVGTQFYWDEKRTRPQRLEGQPGTSIRMKLRIIRVDQYGDEYGIESAGFGEIVVPMTDLVLKQTTSYQRYKSTNAKLFDREPTVEDVKQTNLGDCYLQAAIAGIVNTSPEYIKTMMGDYGKTVSVRLYKVHRTDSNKPPTFTPKYIKVEKSTPQDDRGNELYNRGALWVKMIQKAYVIGGFAGDYFSRTKKSQSKEFLPKY